MRLHNDEPTLDDLLGREELVQRLGDEIAACDPPHVFGVHGDWGAGKTSFLHRLQVYLTGDCPQQGFEAWRYQHDQAPIVALLQESRTQLPWYSKALKET